MEPLINYQQASDLLGIKVGTLYAYVSQARIPHIRMSRRMVRFRPSELERWVEEFQSQNSGIPSHES
jgi:excisionase family DNA binding protein